MPFDEIETISQDKRLCSSNKLLKTNNKKIETPRKAISLSNNRYSEGLTILDNEIRGIYETYKKMNKDKLVEMGQYSDIERRFTNSISNNILKASANEGINYFLFNYDSRTDQERKSHSRQSEIPSKNEVEYLVDLLLSNSNDIVVPPLLPYLDGNQHIEFLDIFYNTIESYNNHVIGGLVPTYLGRLDQNTIIDYYLKKDIKILFFDLYGSSPDRHYPSVSLLMRKVLEKERTSKTKHMIVATNVRFGRPHRKTTIAPAKDIISLFLGFDVFSRPHVIKMAFDSPVGGAPPKKTPPNIRLFQKEDYGYYQTDRLYLNQIPTELNISTESNMDIRLLNDTNQRSVIDSYNTYEHGKEAQILRTNFKDEVNMGAYIRQKKQLPEKNIKQILNLKGNIEQQKLI